MDGSAFSRGDDVGVAGFGGWRLGCGNRGTSGLFVLRDLTGGWLGLGHLQARANGDGLDIGAI